jgi:hypothetical protein
MRIIVAGLLLLSTAAAQGRKTGSPLDHLPRNIEILTHFGERADFSPDNQRVAFMAKSFGDAFVIDLKSRVIRCLTCNVPGAAFLRVMYLPSGDYILIGAERFKDLKTSRHAENELWFLSKTPGSKPLRFGQRMSEGAAISKRNMRIAFSETSSQNPELPSGASRLILADVDVSNPAAPKILNHKMVYEGKTRDCVIESQDFYDNDSKMTFSCYEPKGMASAMSIDFVTGKVMNLSNAPGTYNEAEGIWPGGKYTLVEADRQVQTLGGAGGFREIDIWKLRIDSGGKDFVRLTRFNDYEGWKASNPVVSSDARFMAFQVAKTADEAGVGYGICLYRIE